LSFSLEKGEILALLGPSGCGKTTLLRCLAGLERMDQGSVSLEGREMTGLAPEKRQMGLVFQQPVLFPHMDVGRNVAYGLELAEAKKRTLTENTKALGRWLCRAAIAMFPPLRRRLPASPHARRVAELLEIVGLAGFEKRKVDTLSGGEAQRVALARALAPEPRVLLLDEPLSSLDRVLRETLRRELRAILRSVGVTAIYVTHDQGEAAAVADRVALMRDGRIVQMDTPARLYQAPVDAWAARFLGLENLVPVEIAQGHVPDDRYIKIITPLEGSKELLVPAPTGLETESLEADWELLLPPGALGLGRPAEGIETVELAGTVPEVEMRPGGARVRVMVKGKAGSHRFMVTVGVGDGEGEGERESIPELTEKGDMVRLWMAPQRARLVRGQAQSS